MSTLIEHLIKLTDHRDRDLLELTLAKALIDLTPIQRVVVARIMSVEDEQRWLDLVSLDARGGGKVLDPLRIEFAQLPRLQDSGERLRCLREQQDIELAWAGPQGPRIYFLPLFAQSSAPAEQGVIEVHSAGELTAEDRQTIAQLRHIYRNMHALLAYSERDALTGLLNRKSLDDTFYSAVLAELDGSLETASSTPSAEQERRHRVPPNYWIGSIRIDNAQQLNKQHGQFILEEVTLLVSRIMGNTFRTHDRLYRFDGEEFAVLFHCPEESQALAAFERLRANVERHKFPQLGRVSVCAGFTRVLSEDTPDSALERAAQAVKQAQQSGGNQVCSHPDLVRRGVLSEPAQAGAQRVS